MIVALSGHDLYLGGPGQIPSRMDTKSTQLQSTLARLRSRATRHSVTGAAIAIAADLLAALLSSYLEAGRIDIASIIAAHQANSTLWLLYAMPFVFAVRGPVRRRADDTRHGRDRDPPHARAAREDRGARAQGRARCHARPPDRPAQPHPVARPA